MSSSALKTGAGISVDNHDSLVTRGFRVGTGEWGRLGVEGLDVPVGGCVVADEVVVVRPTPSG